MLPQRKKETTIRPQCNIFPVFTYQIQYIKPQTSFQNTWNWIMASKQVAQTRRRNTSPHFQSTSVFWGTIWGLLMGFEGCRGTRWGDGAEFQIKFHLFSSRLFCSKLHVSNELHAQIILLYGMCNLFGTFSSQFSPLISGACRICRLQFSWWKSRYSVQREG